MGGFFLLHFKFLLDLVANKNRLNQTRSQDFFLCSGNEVSAETWSLKGMTIRTVGLSPGVGIGCYCCCGYFSLEKITLNRSHTSETYDQHDDKQYARSSVVFNSLQQPIMAHIDMALVVEQKTRVRRFYVNLGLDLRGSDQ